MAMKSVELGSKLTEKGRLREEEMKDSNEKYVINFREKQTSLVLFLEPHCYQSSLKIFILTIQSSVFLLGKF